MDSIKPDDFQVAEKTANAIVEEVVRMFTCKRGTKNLRRRCQPSVPIDHCGPVPNIEVGTCWKYRWQVSEAGIHRPTVAGIHGRENKGAYSIVLSGVYEEDKDNGETFLYSGCGGKERDKTKRLSPQVYDQQLTRHNRGLALCCNAPLDDRGACAENWRGGKPVRVVRKHSKFSIYAPKEGFRYDGIYKVVKYYPVVNQRTGLRVWTYELRRDDLSPAPWTPEGEKRIAELGLSMIVPEDTNMLVPENTDMLPVEKKEEEYMSSQVGNKLVLKKRRPKMPSKELRPSRCSNLSPKKYDFRMRAPRDYAEEDVKPDLSELSFASGAFVPWAESSPTFDAVDVKPTMAELMRRMENPISAVDAHCMDIDEDIKPNIDQLNAMMGITSTSEPVKIEPTDLPVVQSLPVIQSTSSLAAAASSEIASASPTSSGLLQISPRKSEHKWEISQEFLHRIDQDILNRFTWDYLKTIEYRSKEDFLNRITIMFSCPVCANIVREPITTPCNHNICFSCLVRNFERGITSCQYCNRELPDDIIQKCGSNVYLISILNFVFENV